jgi:hypothetical protein
MAMDSPGGRTDYNMTIQKTNSSEMLLNLVRLRYYDTPFFLQVGNVTTQMTFKGSALPKLVFPGLSSENPWELGGEFSWTDQPTIQYVPLEGQQFATQLLQPINLSNIQLLVNTGWDVDRLFRLAIQNLDQLTNAPVGSGPAAEMIAKYKEFFEATKLMRYFQAQGTLRVGIQGTTKDEELEEEVLQIAFPINGDESKRLVELLGNATQTEGMYVVSMLKGYTNKGVIGVLPRSLLSCMYYLSLGVNVPKGDLAAGKVPTWDKGGFDFKNTIHDLINIQSCVGSPSNAYVAVKYRGYWFYISDNDLNSKRTFMMLLQLYNLQSIAHKKAPPLLTLPLGK